MRNERADAKGNFDIRGVTPGRYSLSAYTYLHGKVCATRALIDVGNSGLDNVSLAVGPGVDIPGT